MTTRYSQIAFCLALTFIGASASFAQSGPRQVITVDELVKTLQSQDEREIVASLNKAKQSQESQALVVFMKKLWSDDEKDYPNLQWQFIKSDGIRIEIADFLVQVANNGLLKIDRDEFHRFALQVIEGSNENPKRTAILVLGLLRYTSDVKLLEDVALSENPRTFRVAILALVQNCRESAVLALKEIKAKIHDAENRKFLDNHPSC
jgi:hypothetical protein